MRWRKCVRRLLGGVVTALALAPSRGFAQLDAPAEPVLPAAPTSAPSHYQQTVTAHRPSPEWTQDRSFSSTRVWLLDPGKIELEMWFRTRIPQEVGGVRGPAEFLWQHEIELGLFPHVQVDFYENLTLNVDANGQRGIQQEGNQIEARIAIPSYFGQVFGNPVIYLEWHPRHNNPDRAEVRLLLGQPFGSRLYVALNPYVESNVESTETLTVSPLGKSTTTSQFIADAEVGTTVAIGFRITDWFRLSAELKIGADMLGDANNNFHFVAWAGPGFIVKPLPGRAQKYLKIMGTCLIALPGTAADAQQLEPLVIIGSAF